MNPKVHPLLSDLIMKALMKDPEERYQSGKQLLEDLENCKEARPAAPTNCSRQKRLQTPLKTNAVAEAKFAGPVGTAKAVDNKVAVPPPSIAAQPVVSGLS